MKRRYLSKKKFVIGLLAGLITLFLAVGFIQRVLPGLLESQYKRQINESFDTFFTPDLNNYLKKMGVVLKPDGPASCDNGPYSPSTPCGKTSFSEYINFDKSSADKWTHTSKQLDAYLAAHGWQREKGERNTTFAGIFAPTDFYQTAAFYKREAHGVHCNLIADHLAEGPYGRSFVVEGCSKYTRSPTELP